MMGCEFSCMTEHTRRLEELDKTADLSIWKIQFTEQDAEVQKSLEMASKPSYVALDQGSSEHRQVTGMGSGTT